MIEGCPGQGCSVRVENKGFVDILFFKPYAMM